jgi:hypothetical protein
VSELRAIQKHVELVGEAREWAEDVLCLRHGTPYGTHFRRVLNRPLQHRFLAVSWTRQPSPRGDSSSGAYSVLSLCRVKSRRTAEQRVKLDIRSSVLDSIVRYLKTHDIDIFWVDKACIDQANTIKQAESRNSMDFVHKNAKKTVGLLSIPICSSTGAQLLASLLDGDFATFQL